jgi:Fe-S cluster biogenesis protein NfuA
MTQIQPRPIGVRAEVTPNPQSLKFVFDRAISSSTAEFKQGESTLGSPLAKKLFGFPWTEGVYIGTDFVTVTKQDWVDWDTLTEPLSGLIAEHIERGEPILIEVAGQVSQSGNEITPQDSPLVQKIKKILNDEIRPAVAQDGGDVIFSKFEDNVVHLFMRGSCAGCPSSTYTLKEGIATRLRLAVPEIIDVVSVN